MTMRPVLGFLMVVLTAVVFAVNHQARVVPISAIALAGVGMFGLIRIRVAARRELIGSLLVALIFVGVWRLTPAASASSPVRRLVSLLTNYFMLLQVAQFFIRRSDDLPAHFPFYSAMTLIAAGNVMATPREDTIYQCCALGFTALAAVYAACCKEEIPRTRSSRRHVAAAILLGVAVTGAGIVGSLMFRYREDLDRFFMRQFERRFTAAGSTRPSVIKLDTVTPRRLGANRHAVALRVFSDESPGYVKGAAYTKLHNSTWQKDMSGAIHTPQPAGSPRLTGLPEDWRIFVFRTEQADRWQRFVVWPGAASEGLYTPMHTAAVGLSADSVTVSLQGTVESSDLLPGAHYAAFVPDSISPVPLDADRRRRLTGVSLFLDLRVRAIAAEVFEHCVTTADKIEAVVRHFNSHYTYKIGIGPPEDADPLTWFLVERPPAHCEYFAAGAALLLRLADVPACYITGYVVSERNPHGRYWIARNKDAHAWVEAYDENRGWVLVEATPGGGVPGVVKRNRISYVWDTIKFRIRELYILITTRGLPGLGLWIAGRFRGFLSFLISLSVTSILLKSAVLGLLVWWVWQRVKRRPTGRPEDPTRAALRRLLSHMDRRLRVFGLVRSPGETLHRFARRVAEESPGLQGADAFSTWYLAYAVIRYREDVGEEDLRNLRERMPRR